MKILKEIVFWVITMIVLVFAFGQSNANYIQSFYFVTLLIPVIIGLNYFFNHFLLPRYLLRKRYWQFALYSFYTFIVSLYLEIMVLTLAFIILANYNYQNLNPVATNVFLLCLILYGVVFFNAFIILVRKSFARDDVVKNLMKEKNDAMQDFLIVRADRKNHKLAHQDTLYVESLSDYVRIVPISSEPIVTKEKISVLQKRLPPSFLRIHRSFIVNTTKIDSFTKEEVDVGGCKLPISRTYKKEVITFLQKSLATEKPISTLIDN